MRYADGMARLKDLRGRIGKLREEMRSAQAAIEPEEVSDYEFATLKGPVRLSELFNGKDDLFVVHNMGTSCSSCTMWADGCNGFYPHVADRAGFVVSSPDDPQTQREFAASRGWRFPMVSHVGTNFAQDMGYRSSHGGWLPGLSVFRRDGGRLTRVSDARWSPGDDFCPVWHFFDMLPGGSKGWMPRFQYG
ncbi:DUF899 family protein [Terrarubrum flagellatum]|uniref:DUF899 family protein n=1 Tax=Terrirubrum flagellatum TaxID=2895980 RepID=UPI00314502FE